MIESLNELDQDLDSIGITKKDIINSITLNDVRTFLESLGVDQISINEEKQYLVCPTVCHNPLHEAHSMKLYWYQNNKIFRCYTECNEAMSIFTLYQKFMKINSYEVSDAEAEEYVRKCLQHIAIMNVQKKKPFSIDTAKYEFNMNIPKLPAYPKETISYFTKYHHPNWLADGITSEVMDKFNIRFSIVQNKIIIPHKDISGNLIGIRGRTLNKQEAEQFGKYRPIQIGDTLYSHPLQFNLYGIYEHKAAIQKSRIAIIAEGEKSVLLDDVYYGEYANCVACCGSTFNKYHISMLTNILGANEIVVALDKEYEDWKDSKAKVWRNKIETMCRKYINEANFSYIWDYDNLLKEKDSPFDRGKEVFEELYKNRVKVR